MHYKPRITNPHPSPHCPTFPVQSQGQQGTHRGRRGSARCMCLKHVFGAAARSRPRGTMRWRRSMRLRRSMLSVFALMLARALTVHVATKVTADTAQPPSCCCGSGSAIGGLAPTHGSSARSVLPRTMSVVQEASRSGSGARRASMANPSIIPALGGGVRHAIRRTEGDRRGARQRANPGGKGPIG